MSKIHRMSELKWEIPSGFFLGIVVVGNKKNLKYGLRFGAKGYCLFDVFPGSQDYESLLQLNPSEDRQIADMYLKLYNRRFPVNGNREGLVSLPPLPEAVRAL